jgi:DNA-binding YbaB/EbfC family protein
MHMKVDLNKLLQQAQDMQSKMQSAQEALTKIVVTGEAGGGLLKIDMDGRHAVRSIWLDPALLKESKEFIEELLISAFNNALEKAEKASRQKLSDLTAQIQTKFSTDLTEL